MPDKERKMVQVRVTMPEDYRRLFKAYCTEIGTDMSKMITELIENKLIEAGKVKKETNKSAL